MKTWLPIKQDYLIENFDSLLQYLSEADYDSSIGDGFLIETVEKLEEVARDLLENKFSHKLGVTDDMDNERVRDLKIVAASIVASHKMKRDVSQLLVSLLDTLVVNRLLEDVESLAKIKDLIVSLSQGRGVRQLSFGFRDISAPDFTPALFANKAMATTAYATENYRMAYVGRGGCTFEDGRIYMTTEDPSEIKDLRHVGRQDVGLDVVIQSDGLDDLDFRDRVVKINVLMQSMANARRKAVKKRKTYTEEDEIFVQVVNVSPVTGWVTCRTLDPEYETLELSLNLLPYYSPNPYLRVMREDFLRYLQIGDKLKVKREGKKYFSIHKTLDEYYYDLSDINDTPGMDWARKAIFMRTYASGTSWLTGMGKGVNIMTDPTDEAIKEAESDISDKAIEILYGEARPDKKGNMVINARRVGEILDEDRVNFRESIPRNLIEDMVSYWGNLCPDYKEEAKEIPSVPEFYIRTLAHLLAAAGNDLSMTQPERYMSYAGAAMLAIMLGDSHDEAFCEFSMAYLRALWAFAQDTGHEWLGDIPVPPEIEGLPLVEQEREIARILSTYKDGNGAQLIATLDDNRVDVERVKSLVEASNTLIGNISLTEINRIKRAISKCLGIGSIYKEEASGKMSFGEEDSQTEFKTSIVFPPSRKGHESPLPDPDVQIWAILRTINGFLNSADGGTLYIGVNDNGNPTGIELDMKWLYDNKRQLLEPTPDRYMQYVKFRADNAFKAYDRSDRDREITSPRVSYTYYKTDGGTVLKVDVQPYELGCVRMKSRISLPGTGIAINRPDFVKEAYIRTAATTEELTEKMRKKVRDDKRSDIKDNDQRNRIFVQDAIDNNRCLLLKEYESVSGTRDRVMEPIELLPMRGLIVGRERGVSEVRVFKINRCSGVEVLEESFKPSAARQTYSVDPFNMLSASDRLTLKLHLRLDRFAWLRLKESFPYAEQYVEEDGEDKEYPYSLKCSISDERGVGSFCMSVLGHFRIMDCPRLEAHLRDLASVLA